MFVCGKVVSKEQMHTDIRTLLLTLGIAFRLLEESLEGEEGREEVKEVNERVCAELKLRLTYAQLALDWSCADAELILVCRFIPIIPPSLSMQCGKIRLSIRWYLSRTRPSMRPRSGAIYPTNMFIEAWRASISYLCAILCSARRQTPDARRLGPLPKSQR